MPPRKEEDFREDPAYLLERIEVLSKQADARNEKMVEAIQELSRQVGQLKTQLTVIKASATLLGTISGAIVSAAIALFGGSGPKS